MANMVLGAYTFDLNPAKVSGLIQSEKASAVKKTYTDIAYFSWPSTVKGRQVSLRWEYIPTAQFTSIHTLYASGDTLVFDPQDGSSKTYNVEVLNFEAEYFLHMEDATGNYRKNAQLELLILSEVV